MKKTKTIYWIVTILAMLTGATSGYFYFTSQTMIDGFRHLGFPDYFRIELGIAKILGSLAILFPIVPTRIKEWAYVGYAITLLSAFIAHTVVDGPTGGLFPLIPLGLLLISYIYFHKLQKTQHL